jgi:paraquat-inducible protein B
MTESVSRTSAQAEVTLRQLNETLGDLGDVIEQVGGAVEPGSPVFVQFEQAMTDLSGASRALRNLAEYLERNPSSIIRGRPGGN